MADKKKGAHTKQNVKSIATKQRTLYDLFPKQISLASNAPAEIPQERRDASPAPDPVALVSSSPGISEEIATTIVVEKLRQASLEPRTIHPFFAKTTRFVQSSAPSEKPSIPQDTVIEITDERSTSTGNTTPDDLTELLPLSQESGSQQDPIVLDSSPLKTIRLRNPCTSNKPLAPLFARLPPKTSAVVTVTSKSPKALRSQAPYPDRISQHVRGPQHTFNTPYLPCGRRARRVAQSFKETPGETSRLLKNLMESRIYPSVSPQYTSSATAGNSNLTTTPLEDLHHPAITCFGTQSKHSSTHRLWADKWRPTRAAEVLGNEANGIYLRDWLSAHALHLAKDAGSGQEDNNTGGKAKDKADIRGTKRPRVVRAVEKRRGRKKRKIDSDGEDEDDWIVYSDASEADDYLVRDSDGGRSSPPLPHEDSTAYQPSLPAPISDPRSNARQTFDPLTNTILLAGPSGSGKTAAVYACAEELGWEVFEVYPGLGKRNAAGIDSFIGDAGKNHHVRKTRTGDAGISEGRNALSNLLRSSREYIPAEETVVDIEVAHPPSDDLGCTSSHSADMMEAAPFVRQSLILLEEVDILFKEDGSFWPAVTNFIKDCRRPVVCTCNDISLVPTRDLPLQAILDFKPCSPALAASYLQGLCSAEGCTLERKTLLQLYEDSVFKPDSLDIPDLPTPSRSDDFPAQDLRRTINCLQFWCSSANSGIEHTSGWETLSDAGEDLCDWNSSIEQRSRKSPDGLSADQSSFATAMRTEAPPRRLLAAHHADIISFVDSHLMRRPWDTPGALAWSSCKPSNDDEVGHTILFYPRHVEEVSFGLRDQDQEIAFTAMWLSRGALEVGRTREPTSIGISPFRTRQLFRARVDHQLRMVKALGDIVPLSILKMRRAEVQMDYEASIRDIVAAEDMEELAHLRKQRSGRMTRNSRGEFVRTLMLTMESRTALTETVLPPI